MASTISQRIELEGGEEIKRQLDAIGKTGKASFEQLEAASLAAAQNLNRVVQAVASVERSFAAVGASARAFGAAVGNISGDFNKFESALGRSVRNVSLFGAAVTGAVFGFNKLAQNVGKSADEIGEQAAGIGLTTKAYQDLSLAAADSGVSQSQFGKALSNLNKILVGEAQPALDKAAKRVFELGLRFPNTEAGAKSLGEAVGNVAAQIENANRSLRDSRGQQLFNRFLTSAGAEAEKTKSALERLGISTVGLDGKIKSAAQILLEIADAFTKIPEGAEKARLAADLFGGVVGRKMVDFLNKGSAGIIELAANLEKLRFSPEQIESADAYQRSLLLLNTAVTRTKDQLALLFAPALSQLALAFTDSILRNFDGLRDGLSDIVKNQIEPVVNDLVGILSGRQTVIQNTWLLDWQKNIVDFGKAALQAINIVRKGFDLLLSGAQRVADGLNAVFGTELTGGAVLATAAILKFLGVFTLLGAALGLAGGAIRLVVVGLGLLRAALVATGSAVALLRFLPLLLTGFGPLLIAGLVVALPLIIAFWDKFKTAAKVAFPEVVAAVEKGMLAIRDALGVPPEQGIFDWIKVQWDAQWGKISDDAKTIVARSILDALDLKPDDTLFSWLKRQWDSKWDDIKANARQQSTDALARIGAQDDAAANRGFDWLGRAWDNQWQKITEGVKGKVDGLAQQLGATDLDKLLGGAQLGSATEAQRFSDNIDDRRGDDTATALNEAAAAAATLAAQIAQILSQLQQVAQTAFNIQFPSFDGVVFAAQDLVTQLQQAAQAALQIEVPSFDQAVSQATDLANLLQEAAQAAASIDIPSSDGGGDGFAAGGHVRGPGSSRSDSIIARLSNGEFIVQADAVASLMRRYGSGVMSFINSGKLPGFSMGGLVAGLSSAMTMPRSFGGMAELAPAAARTPITLVVNGQRITGLSGSDDAVSVIKRAAVSGQLASAGSSPSWVR